MGKGLIVNIINHSGNKGERTKYHLMINNK